MKNFIFALLLCALALPLFAQNTDSKLGIDFTIRPRTEFRNGSFTLRPDNVNPAFFTSSRNRMGLSFFGRTARITFCRSKRNCLGTKPTNRNRC